jgi:hypothetical protein
LTWVRSPLIRAISLLTLSLAVSRYNNLQTRPDTCKATPVRNKTKFSAKATFSYWFDDFDSVTNQLEHVSGLCHLRHLGIIQDLVCKSLVDKHATCQQLQHTVWSSVLVLLPD